MESVKRLLYTSLHICVIFFSQFKFHWSAGGDVSPVTLPDRGDGSHDGGVIIKLFEGSPVASTTPRRPAAAPVIGATEFWNVLYQKNITFSIKQYT